MFRKLALAGALIAGVTLAALAATPLHTYNNSVGTEQETIGVHCINNSTGEPESCGAGGGSGGGPATIADGADVTQGAKADAKSTATDTTPITMMSVLKQVSASVQAIASSVSGTLTVATHAVTQSGTWTVTPLASENHVGELGNNQITITVPQTITASSAYVAGNAVGGLITFTGAARVSGAAGAAGTSGLVQSAIVNSKSAQTTQMDLVLFSANPTGSTCTDKTAIAVAVADFDKVLGVAKIMDWTNLGTPSVGQGQNLAMPYALASSTTLYGCLVTRATPTFAATTDISVGLRVIRN